MKITLLGGSTWFGGTIAWGSRNAQLRYAVRCKTVQCLNTFTNDTQDVQTLVISH